MARYTYGDDDPAVQRLALVARAYEPLSSAPDHPREQLVELREALERLTCGGDDRTVSWIVRQLALDA